MSKFNMPKETGLLRPALDPASLCLGQTYRCRRNTFVSSKGHFVSKVSMISMKKMSCAGCEYCIPMVEELNEVQHKSFAPDVSELEDGKLYRLAITNIFVDYETGYAEDWDLEFILEDLKNVRPK